MRNYLTVIAHNCDQLIWWIYMSTFNEIGQRNFIFWYLFLNCITNSAMCCYKVNAMNVMSTQIFSIKFNTCLLLCKLASILMLIQTLIMDNLNMFTVAFCMSPFWFQAVTHFVNQIKCSLAVNLCRANMYFQHNKGYSFTC